MKQYQTSLTIRTNGRSLIDITSDIQNAVLEAQISTGLCVIFCGHTSASLFIQENADPSVQTDILGWLKRVAPDDDPRYTHNMEGPDDMAAHLRTVMTRTNESIPVTNGNLTLGTWQGIYLAEHRTAPHLRKLVIHITGE